MDPADIRDACILLVEDDPDNARVLYSMLRSGGYQDVNTCDQAYALIDYCHALNPDLLILDLNLETRSGLGLLAEVRQQVAGPDRLPIVVISGDRTVYARHQSLRLGANDFIIKPFDQLEVQLRISNILRLQTLHHSVLQANLILEERVRERTAELVIAQIEFMERLAAAAELRDDVTGKHTARVGATSALLAMAMGLPEAEIDAIRHAAPLHDVGKLAVPETILRKPERLTVIEFDVMKRHTMIGSRILMADSPRSPWPLIRAAEEIARTHHERWDGLGYPHRLRSNEIPLSGRIVAVADVYDALTHQRPYKEAWSSDMSFQTIQKQSGTHFDPDVVLAFESILLDGSLEHVLQETGTS